MIAGRKLMIAGLLGLLAVTPAAQAQVNPFRGSTSRGLSAADMSMLADAADAADRANRAEHPAIGQVEHFSNPETGTAGTVRLARLFHSGGMACHALQYRFTTKGGTRPADYTTNWCRTPDGAWKIKS